EGFQSISKTMREVLNMTDESEIREVLYELTQQKDETKALAYCKTVTGLQSKFFFSLEGI
ncbi:jg26393, partial [Pararge aegeria aegeria]